MQDYKFEETPFDVDEMFDEALVKFEDKIEKQVLQNQNIKEKFLIEVLKYCPSELEDVVLK